MPAGTLQGQRGQGGSPETHPHLREDNSSADLPTRRCRATPNEHRPLVGALRALLENGVHKVISASLRTDRGSLPPRHGRGQCCRRVRWGRHAARPLPEGSPADAHVGRPAGCLVLGHQTGGCHPACPGLSCGAFERLSKESLASSPIPSTFLRRRGVTNGNCVATKRGVAWSPHLRNYYQPGLLEGDGGKGKTQIAALCQEWLGSFRVNDPQLSHTA